MRLSEGQLVFLSLVFSFVPPLLIIASFFLSVVFLLVGMSLAFGFTLFFAGIFMAIDELTDIFLLKNTRRVRSIVRFGASACFIIAGMLSVISHWPA